MRQHIQGKAIGDNMLHIKDLEDGLSIFKALGSSVRIQIIKLLLDNKEMNMNELATALNITNGALTGHMKKLEESGIVQLLPEYAGHGNQKICRVDVDKIFVEIMDLEHSYDNNIYETEVKIGHYSDYSVLPTCGLATRETLVGEVDDPRYFSHAKRVDASILWFTKGFIEYKIPNLLPAGQKIDQITFSLELGSEAPGVNNEWPSDITFFINDKKIGVWTSPGDFGDKRGIFTPKWWFTNWNQYGLLKILVINKSGTYIDGRKISSVTIEQFNLNYRSDIYLKLAIEEEASNVGGLTVYGSGFGNYNQDIKVRIHYESMQ